MVLAFWAMPVAAGYWTPFSVITVRTLNIQLTGFRGAAAKNGIEGFQVTRKCSVTESFNKFIIVLIYKNSHFHAHTPSILICRVLISSLMVSQLSFSVMFVKWV